MANTLVSNIEDWVCITSFDVLFFFPILSNAIAISLRSTCSKGKRNTLFHDKGNMTTGLGTTV